MAVIINLKEIFATDSQTDVSSKLNFNFNQLIALGIGQTGSAGPTGLTGAAGPIGPIGLTGPQGSVTYGLNSAVSPAVTPTGGTYPSAMVVGDILITGDAVLKKVSTGSGWLELANFNTLVQTALSSNISPFVKLTPTSRILKSRVSSGSDLTNSLTSTDPSYATPGAGVNYQTVLYNFNELKTKSLIFDGSSIVISPNASIEKTFAPSSAVDPTSDQITFSAVHGLVTGQYVTYSAEGGTAIGGLSNFNGYFVLKIDDYVIQLCQTAADVVSTNPINLTTIGSGSSPHKLITYPASTEKMFPATANLSLYSYFNATATTAKEFATTSKGYRHQLELGSVDALPTAYPGVTSDSYLISPSFENLRVRKYRLAYTTPFGDTSNPGNYFLRAEYDLSSTGITASPESFAPRRSSEHIWKINRAEAAQNDGRSIEMKFTNYRILADTEAASGIAIDGLFFKKNTSFGGGSSTAYWGAGFNSASNNITFKIGDSAAEFDFRNLIRVTSSTGASTVYGGSGISGVPAVGSAFVIAAPINDLAILTVDSSKELRLNNAIKIKGDRLNQGIPFPATQIPSTDANTLDDYEEGTWTPILYGGGFAEISANSFTTTNNFDSIITSVIGRDASYTQPVKTNWTSFGGYTESQWIYSGSSSNTSDRIIPIAVHYSKYIKIGKLVKCWVNFTINQEFNFLTGTYAVAGGGTPSDTYTAGSGATRFNPLYNSQEATVEDNNAYKRPAIGLTLPFAPEAAATDSTLNSSSSLASSTGLDDPFSTTQVVGKFHKAVDTVPYSDPTFVPPSPYRPVIISPLFADYPTKLHVTTGAFERGGYVKYGPMNSTGIFPIQNSGHSELRLGRVPMAIPSSGSVGSWNHLLKPAVLFYGSRLWDDTTNSTVSLCPVTALDCMYRSQVPSNSLGAPNGIRVDANIRFQCEFSYLANA
jgi:hypothetical protein